MSFHRPLEPGHFEWIYNHLVQKRCPLSVVGRVRYIKKYFKDFMKEKFCSIKICPLGVSSVYLECLLGQVFLYSHQREHLSYEALHTLYGSRSLPYFYVLTSEGAPVLCSTSHTLWKPITAFCLVPPNHP